jgi:hypothetical protein
MRKCPHKNFNTKYPSFYLVYPPVVPKIKIKIKIKILQMNEKEKE